MHVSYLTVSVSQESGRGLAGFSAHDLTRLESRQQHSAFSPGGLAEEESVSMRIQVVGILHFLWLFEVLIFLLVVGQDTAPIVPGHVALFIGFHNMVAPFFRATKGKSVSLSGLLRWGLT